MKRRCIIHFGMHKTGSSSIQESLFRYAENLPDWHYLHVGSANLSGAIATAFGDHPTRYHANRKRGLTESAVNVRAQEIRSKLTAQLQESVRPSLLLSAEYISAMSHTELLRLVDWLAGQVDNIQAVGYIRAPGSFAASLFQQRVKGGQNRLDLSDLIPRYQDRFEIFDHVLGRDRVQFWKFDPAAFPGGCVVRDFCNRLSIPLPEAHIIRINEGLSRDAVSLLYAYRKYGPGFGVGPTVMKENGRLVALLAKLSGPKLQFAVKVLKPTLRIRCEQIGWMEERLTVSLDESPVDQSDAIQDEMDLLRFSPESVRWLTEQLDIDFIASPTPEMIAEWMHVLRQKITKEASSASRISRQSESPVRRKKSVPFQKKIKTLYLHIGTEKTGTTTLQAFLNKSRNALAGQGIAYPKSPGLFNHRKLITYCLDNTHVDDAIRNENLIDLAKREEWRSNFIKDFINEMIDLSRWATTVVISSEHGHSRLVSISEIQRLYEALSPFFDQIKVIVYLRRQDQLAVSSYSTKIKSGATTLEFKARDATRSYYNYQLLLECWSNIFGKDSILAVVYDRSRLIRGSIIDDFAAQIGLNIANLAAIKNRNTGLSSNALEILRIFNSQVPENIPRQVLRPLHSYLIALLESSNQPPHRPARDEAMAFYRLFEQSNAIVARDWFAGNPLFDDDFSSYPEKKPVITIDKKAVSKTLSSAISRLVKYEGSQVTLAPISHKSGVPELIRLGRLINDQSSNSTHSACEPKATRPVKNSIDEKPFILGLQFKNHNLDQLATKDLCKVISKNTGNLAFHYAIDFQFGSQLESVDWSSKLEEINSQKGYAILPCANQLGAHTALDSLANHFSRIDRPIVAIGLGAQSSSITVIPQLAQGTIRWVKEIINHAPSNYPNIGVRGEFTRRVLEQYGLGNHVEIIGCPSLFINPNPGLGRKIHDRIRPVRRIAVAAGSFRRTHLLNLEKSLVDLVTKTEGAYIIQSPLEMISIARGEISSLPKSRLSIIRNYAWSQLSEEEFVRWTKIYAHCFFNVPDWINYLRQFDFVIGTRIHGIILALQAEVPALCIVHDSRTLELCQTMKIPFVPADQVLEGVSINDIPHLFNFDPDVFDRNRVKLAKTYVNFLHNNQLKPNSLFEESKDCVLDINPSHKKPEKFFINNKKRATNPHEDLDLIMIKKPTLHIHIGQGKTGTSAIQNALRENFFSLEKKGFFYLGMCFENIENKVFSWNYRDGGDQLMSFSVDQTNKEIHDCLISSFNQAIENKYQHLIWSNERLYRNHKKITLAIKEIVK